VIIIFENAIIINKSKTFLKGNNNKNDFRPSGAGGDVLKLSVHRPAQYFYNHRYLASAAVLTAAAAAAVTMT
jgi:hypothetical protein